MDDPVSKAFDFASDSTKQLITLSTAILALTITFNKDVLHNVSAGNRIILTGAWIVYLLSICLGIATLLALTGTLDPIPKRSNRTAENNSDENGDVDRLETNAGEKQSKELTPTNEKTGAPVVEVKEIDAKSSASKPTIQGGNVRVLSGLQIVTFLVATTLVVISGAYAVRGLSTSDSDDPTAKTEKEISELHRRLFEALLRRDTSTIEHYTSARGIILGPDGQVLTRDQLVVKMNSGALRYESISPDNISVHVYGDTVVEAAYCQVSAVLDNSHLEGEFRYSAVFIKAPENWQAVSFQFTRLNAEPKLK